ncbi:MAG TPA: MBL fold metallo-hydrolase [Longimicrobiales bacterium]
MKILTFTGGPFAENGYLAICRATREAVAIDPGAVSDRMVAALRQEGARLAAILLTHAHLDHVEGVPELRSHADAPIYLHRADIPLYEHVQVQAAAFGVPSPDLPMPTWDLNHDDVFTFGKVELEVRHAPGHSPGHVILVASRHGVAFVGDVVFSGSIGRTDLPGGDFRTLLASIREQVLTLPEDTRLLTGHGPATTVARERADNPFLVPEEAGGLG